MSLPGAGAAPAAKNGMRLKRSIPFLKRLFIGAAIVTDKEKPESITDAEIDAFDQKSREAFERELREQQKQREDSEETQDDLRDMIRQERKD